MTGQESHDARPIAAPLRSSFRHCSMRAVAALVVVARRASARTTSTSSSSSSRASLRARVAGGFARRRATTTTIGGAAARSSMIAFSSAGAARRGARGCDGARRAWNAIGRCGSSARARAYGALAAHGGGLDDEVGSLGRALFYARVFFVNHPRDATPMMLYTALSSLLELHRDAFGLTRGQPVRQT